MILLILFFLSKSDDLYFIDYRKHLQYNWESLRKPQDSQYIIQQPEYTFYFNLGAEVEQKCHEFKGSVVRLSPQGCMIMGNHELRMVHTYNYQQTGQSGISITYKSIKKCSNIENWSRTTFKIKCSEKQTPFKLISYPNECHLTFQKLDPIGCGQEYRPYHWLILLSYSFLALMIFLIVFACISECIDQTPVDSDNVFLKMVKSLVRSVRRIGNNKVFVKSSYEPVQQIIRNLGVQIKQ